VSQFVPRIPAEQMTPRARFYLGTNVLLHGWLAFFCLLAPQTFHSTSYDGVKTALPLDRENALTAWGLLFLLTATLSAVAAWRGSEYMARCSLLLSAICCAAWVGGFIAAYCAGVLTGPTGLAWSTAIMAKDLSMLRQPLRNPFEPYIRRFAEATSRDD
jgi:hypothetical protein